MKNLYFLFLLIFFVGCSSDDTMEFQNDTMNNELPMATPDAFISGSFVSDAHPTSGLAEVNKEKTKLIFKSFMSDDGPKLLGYLSTDKTSTDFVNL